MARIYPDYLVAWLLTIPVVIYEGSHFDRHAIVLSFFLLQSWWPSTFVVQAWNGVAWTLSCEAFFYLLPLHRGEVRVTAPSARPRPLPLPPHSRPRHHWHGRYQRGPPLQTLVWLQTYFPPVRLCEFLVGLALGIELQRGTLPRIRLWASGLILLLAYVLLAWGGRNWLTDPVFIPVLALVVVAAQRDVAGRRTVWSWRPLALIGECSYAFYLLHELVIRVWAQANHQEPISATAAAFFWFFALLAIAAALGVLLVRSVEVPSERRLRGSPTPRLEVGEDLQPERPG